MSDLFWLTDEQMERLRPFFPKSHGMPRVDDRRVLNGIVFGAALRDAPSAYSPPKTLYNRWKRWAAAGVFTGMIKGLATAGAEPRTVLIDATYLTSPEFGWAPSTTKPLTSKIDINRVLQLTTG